MTFFQAAFLSIVQGLTEFLPISSSGHLFLLPKLFGWQDQGLNFDAAIHLGTLMAIIVYFRKDLIDLAKAIFSKGDEKKKHLILMLLLSTIPAVFAGFLFKPFFETQARAIPIVAANLIIWGIVLLIAERHAQKRQDSQVAEQLSWKQSFFIGIAQALALLPGTSRSGITISAGIFSNLSREQAVRFSFLMGVPVILGAGILSIIDMGGGLARQSPMMLLMVLFLSFLSGLGAIYLLLHFLSRRGLYFFGIYRILLGLVLLLFFL